MYPAPSCLCFIWHGSSGTKRVPYTAEDGSLTPPIESRVICLFTSNLSMGYINLQSDILLP
jgi:hypothetical protein